MPGILETGRLKALSPELRLGSGPCPFVVDDEGAEFVSLSHFSGGRDVTYVVVVRKPGLERERGLAVTIRYAPFVEGTTIIYDATAETMQGKARPFVCKLGELACRVYAVMPFQIEKTLLRMERVGSDRRLHVAFLDARGAVIEGALPFEVGAEHRTTNRNGRCWFKPDFESGEAVIRSQLTSHEASIRL